MQALANVMVPNTCGFSTEKEREARGAATGPREGTPEGWAEPTPYAFFPLPCCLSLCLGVLVVNISSPLRFGRCFGRGSLGWRAAVAGDQVEEALGEEGVSASRRPRILSPMSVRTQ